MNVCATFLVIYAVDRWGRRAVLIGGATHMFITQVLPLQHTAESQHYALIMIAH